MMILILPPPIGYVHLYQAVETVGRAACGARWVSVHCQDELKGAMMAPSAALQDVIMSIAEACEAGKLAAAYPNALEGGVDVLDPGEWRKSRLHVETYFASGEVILYLPYSPPRRELARCPRKIFIRKDSLAEFIKSLEPAPVATTRYPGDAALIEEGRRMMASGMEKRAVARQLASRAEGPATFDSKVDRLRRAL